MSTYDFFSREIRCYCRDLHPADYDAVEDISLRAMPPGICWTKADFRRMKRSNDKACVVAESRGKGPMVLGYMIYELIKPGCFWLASIAVAPECQKCGVGTRLMRRLTGHGVPTQSPIYVDTHVPDDLTHVHCWLRREGWRATRVERAVLKSERDHYLFEYRFPEAV